MIQVQRSSWRSYSTVSEVSAVSGYPIVPVVNDAVAPRTSTLENAIAARRLRYDWTKDEIKQIYEAPLMELAFAAVSNRSHGS